MLVFGPCISSHKDHSRVDKLELGSSKPFKFALESTLVVQMGTSV